MHNIVEAVSVSNNFSTSYVTIATAILGNYSYLLARCTADPQWHSYISSMKIFIYFRHM